MIHESWYWKKELYKSYEILSNSILMKRFGNASYVKVEKAIMMSAYIIRKLFESNKILPELLSNKIDIITYKNIKQTDFLNIHKLSENYDTKNAQKIIKDYEYIINQIIHSFTFTILFNEKNRFEWILINSDRSRNKSLYQISVYDIVKIILLVSEGDLTDMFCTRVNGEMKIKNGVYNYPNEFDILRIINDLRNGKVYKRINME